jgi:molybdopterin biosynthesis enzyme MoaB
MAEKQHAAEEAAAQTVVQPESEYSVAELAANSKTVFGVMPECVIAAFRVAGKEKATKQAAEKIIRDFMKKEVD